MLYRAVVQRANGKRLWYLMLIADQRVRPLMVPRKGAPKMSKINDLLKSWDTTSSHRIITLFGVVSHGFSVG